MSKKIYIGSTEIAGSDGKSAYQSWLDQGNTGTEAQFLASLQGNSGYSGAAGELEVVNNLTDGGATAALSAQQGVVLRQTIENIVNSLSEFAFPNSKPVLPWITTMYDITYNLEGVSSSDDRTTIASGSSYSSILSAISNLNAVDSDNVVITMGGIDITSIAYSAGQITIDNVSGDITITAGTITYVSSGLSFHLDGLNKGSDPTVWEDTVGGVEFALSNCTFSDKGVTFDTASSRGSTSSSAMSNFLLDSCTIEACFYVAQPSQNFCMLYHSYANAIALNWHNSYGCFSIREKDGNGSFDHTFTSAENISLSLATSGNSIINGATVAKGNKVYFTPASGSICYLGNNDRLDRSIMGTLYSLRIYNRILTDAERMNNYKVDRGRFNF